MLTEVGAPGPSLATGEPIAAATRRLVQLYGAIAYRAKPDSGPPALVVGQGGATRALRWSDIFARMTKAAFEVGKGMRDVLTLSERAVVQHLDRRSCCASWRPRSERSHAVRCSARRDPKSRFPDGVFRSPCRRGSLGCRSASKIVNVFDGNLARGLPNHLAIINLFDPDNGAVTCVMDATYITGIRTAAAAVLSHKLLSRPESRIATIVGAGVQAREHLRLLPLVRDFDEIQICSLEFEHAERLARLHPKARAVRDARAAIQRSDVVCLATDAAAPVIEADWVRGGTHLSPAGYHPPDESFRARSRAITASLSRPWTRSHYHRSDVPSYATSTACVEQRLATSSTMAKRGVRATRISPSTRPWASPWKTWSRQIWPIERLSALRGVRRSPCDGHSVHHRPARIDD